MFLKRLVPDKYRAMVPIAVAVVLTVGAKQFGLPLDAGVYEAIGVGALASSIRDLARDMRKK
jgi:hypothetical protein